MQLPLQFTTTATVGSISDLRFFRVQAVSITPSGGNADVTVAAIDESGATIGSWLFSAPLANGTVSFLLNAHWRGAVTVTIVNASSVLLVPNG